MTPNNSNVVVVHLRQPTRNKPNESRSDPYYEFGSFGCTGCHSHNLMNPIRIDELNGSRLAFAQGGSVGFKLILLTSPVKVVKHKHRCELRWNSKLKPFRYECAPLLINNEGETDFPAILSETELAGRRTWVSQFSSNFRTRRKPLPVKIATSIIAKNERIRSKAKSSDFAKCYSETMPFPPPHIEKNREKRYRMTLNKIKISRC